MGIKVRKIKDFLKDSLSQIKRCFPGRLSGDLKNNLSKNQIYPHGINLIKVLNEDSKQRLKGLGYSKELNIASIGTCFAEELSGYFKNQNQNFKYLSLEKNVFNFSANWGRVYTVKNLLQIISYSLDKKFIPIHVEKYKDVFFDPLREHSAGTFFTEKKAIYEIEKHRGLSKQVLLKADIIFITIGQNEFWHDSEMDIAWGTTPPLSLRQNDKRFKATEYTFNQNAKDLNKIIKKLKEFNSNLKIIFTVSPVAEYATFINNNIISQAFAGKAILRGVLHEIIPKHKEVFYFPSFEYVLTDNPNSFISDNRHVKRFKVKQILQSLEKAIL